MKRILEIIAFFGLWMLLTWSLAWQQLIAGAVFSLVVVVFVGDFFPDGLEKLLNPVRLFWFIIYIPYFAWYILVANFDVAYRVLHPETPINPGIVKVKSTLRTDIAKTFLANSITLTPGTLTVDIVDENFYIHWINVKGERPEEHTALIIDKFEGMVKKIFE